MLTLDDLREVASALARVDLDTLLVVDRCHHCLIQSHFDGKGPLRCVSLARAFNKKLRISGYDGERQFSDIPRFCRSLRNCFISSMRLVGHLFGPADLDEMLATKSHYVVVQAHISGKDVKQAMHLLESIPQCAALTWECSLTSEFFYHASIRNVRYLNLDDVESDHLNAVIHWLHSPTDEVGGRRLCLLIDDCFDADEWTRVLKEDVNTLFFWAFLGDTQSSEYRLFVYGNQSNPYDERCGTAVNAIGDVLEVAAEDHDRHEFCVTRLSKVSAESTTIVASADGPKVWDFGTMRDLDRYLATNGIAELLARSGLIANKMDCECGQPMRLRLYTPMRWTAKDESMHDYAWKCTDGCGGLVGRQHFVELNVGSPINLVDWLGDAATILEAVILLSTGRTNDEIHETLRVMVWDISRLRVIFERMTCLRSLDVKSDAPRRLKEFYENMKAEYHRERPCKANFVVEQ